MGRTCCMNAQKKKMLLNAVLCMMISQGMRVYKQNLSVFQDTNAFEAGGKGTCKGRW